MTTNFGTTRSVNSLEFKKYYIVKMYNPDKKFGFTECNTHFGSELPLKKGDKIHGEIKSTPKGLTLMFIQRPFDVKVLGSEENPLMCRVDNDSSFGEELFKVCPYLYLGTSFGYTGEKRNVIMSDDKTSISFEAQMIESSYWKITKSKFEDRIKIEGGEKWVGDSCKLETSIWVIEGSNEIKKQYYYRNGNGSVCIHQETLCKIEGFNPIESQRFMYFDEERENCLVFRDSYSVTYYDKKGNKLDSITEDWSGGWKKSDKHN